MASNGICMCCQGPTLTNTIIFVRKGSKACSCSHQSTISAIIVALLICSMNSSGYPVQEKKTPKTQLVLSNNAQPGWLILA